jgi:poly(A) polymerase
MSFMSIQIDAVERSLARSFAAAGKSLYLVGGPVRDELLGVRTNDLDFTTDAEPNEIKRLIRSAGADAIYALGERFGTIGGMFGDDRVEITTYRSESYTPGSRKPRVAFDTTLEGDLARRDFTMNAMARLAGGGELIDPFGGRADLGAGVIRAVGDADARFTEDPLRLMRAVRFAAQFGFHIEPTTWAAIARNADKLVSISMERINQEFTKTLLADRPSLAIRALADLGLMRHFLPEFLDLREPPSRDSASRARALPRRPRYKDIFEHTLMVVDRAPPVLNVRLGALLHDIGKPKTMSMTDEEVHFYGHEAAGERMARRILTRMRFDRETVERVGLIISLSGRINSYEGDWTDGAVRRVVREAGDAVDELLMLSRSDVTSRREERVRAAERRVDDLRARIEQLRAEEDIARIKPPLDGNDLMAMFARPPGPWIRPIKEHLLAMVLDGELSPDDRDRAAEIARAMVAEMEPATAR